VENEKIPTISEEVDDKPDAYDSIESDTVIKQAEISSAGHDHTTAANTSNSSDVLIFSSKQSTMSIIILIFLRNCFF
jgi:hypothetical protein